MQTNVQLSQAHEGLTQTFSSRKSAVNDDAPSCNTPISCCGPKTEHDSHSKLMPNLIDRLAIKCQSMRITAVHTWPLPVFPLVLSYSVLGAKQQEKLQEVETAGDKAQVVRGNVQCAVN